MAALMVFIAVVAIVFAIYFVAKRQFRSATIAVVIFVLALIIHAQVPPHPTTGLTTGQGNFPIPLSTNPDTIPK